MKEKTSLRIIILARKSYGWRKIFITSLVFGESRIGPKWDPWGIPDETSTICDKWVLFSVLYSLPSEFFSDMSIVYIRIFRDPFCPNGCELYEGQVDMKYSVPLISVLVQFNSLIKSCRELHRYLRRDALNVGFSISPHLQWKICPLKISIFLRSHYHTIFSLSRYRSKPIQYQYILVIFEFPKEYVVPSK